MNDELHKHSRLYEEYFSVLKDLTNVTFTLEDFEKAWKKSHLASDAKAKPINALEALFAFSVVGFLSTGGHGAGSKYVWRYQDPKAKFSQAARTFQVHLGLKEEFELKFYAKKRA